MSMGAALISYERPFQQLSIITVCGLCLQYRSGLVMESRKRSIKVMLIAINSTTTSFESFQQCLRQYSRLIVLDLVELEQMVQWWLGGQSRVRTQQNNSRMGLRSKYPTGAAILRGVSNVRLFRCQLGRTGDGSYLYHFTGYWELASQIFHRSTII